MSGELGVPKTVSDLLPIRDELLSLISGVPAGPKNSLLAAARIDPYYAPAVELHGLLTKTARGIGRLAGIATPEKPNPELPNISFDHWLDEVIFHAVRDGGNHIIEFGHYIEVEDRVRFESIQTALIYGAHKAAEKSQHPRYFVGAMGFYTNTARTAVGIFSTANSKEHELEAKHCAELYNLETAEEHQLDVCVAICVSGVAQYDDDSGKLPPTPHPCHDCREEIYTNPRVSDSAMIVCAGLDNRIQIFTPHQLLRYHDEI